jgi:hypothetical protein
MEQESKSGLMDQFMKASGWRISLMVEGNWFMQMETSTMETGNRIKLMGRGFMFM